MDFFSGTFGIFSGGIFDFFLAHRFFFLGCNFANFFTGTIFFSRAVFKIFSRALANFLGQNLENFLVENFFFLGEKKSTALQSPFGVQCPNLTTRAPARVKDTE